MRMNKDISVQKIEKRKAVDMNKQINNLITFSFECTKYTEDRITKKPRLLKKKWVLCKNRSRICLSLSTLNSQCMQSLSHFAFTLQLDFGLEYMFLYTVVYVICISLRNNAVCRR